MCSWKTSEMDVGTNICLDLVIDRWGTLAVQDPEDPNGRHQQRTESNRGCESDSLK